MSADALSASRLAEARLHCETICREHARPLWLAALYAPAAARPSLHALVAFEREIRNAAAFPRDPHAAALRLAWWREAALGERAIEAAGSPVALALSTALRESGAPRMLVEAMIEARHIECAPDAPFDRAAFDAYADAGEGAKLRLAAAFLASRGADEAERAAAPAGRALALAAQLLDLPRRAGAAATLLPADALARHGADEAALQQREATAAARAALGALRAEVDALRREAERRLQAAPQSILPAFAPLAFLPIDLARLALGEARPYDPPDDVAPWRRPLALWRWARRRRAGAPLVP